MKLYLLTLTLLFSLSAFAQTIQDDRLALIALYDATNGDNWRENFMWKNTDSDPHSGVCLWAGVICNSNFDRVVGLDLSGNALSGALPKEIGNLTALTSLNLSGLHPNPREETVGGISGDIPSEIGNLVNLEYLDLGAQKFTGTIPASLGNLTKLKFLDLHYEIDEDYVFDPHGAIEGSIPAELGNLINLEVLNLSYQSLTGNIPVELGNLNDLKELNLANNYLSGTIPASLGQLSNLVLLDLSFLLRFEPNCKSNCYVDFGKLSGTIPDLSGLPASAQVKLAKQSFNFDGMEENIDRLVSYNEQNKIPFYWFLPLAEGFKPSYSTNAGGTHANNSYKWYKDNELVGEEDRLESLGPGVYRVEVTNALVPGLTLVSDNYIEDRMPVTLISFSGVNTNSGNLLSWKTASEVNNAGFEVERSTDAKKFDRIGFVDGAITSNAMNEYQFSDESIFATTYYRLKQIDIDGSFDYSRIIAVKKQRAVASVYPNPAQSTIFVKDIEKEENVVIHDKEGRRVLDRMVAPNQAIKIDNFLNGIYTVRIGNESRKIIVQK